jgi:hypothetical protein
LGPEKKINKITLPCAAFLGHRKKKSYHALVAGILDPEFEGRDGHLSDA